MLSHLGRRVLRLYYWKGLRRLGCTSARACELEGEDLRLALINTAPGQGSRGCVLLAISIFGVPVRVRTIQVKLVARTFLTGEVTARSSMVGVAFVCFYGWGGGRQLSPSLSLTWVHNV